MHVTLVLNSGAGSLRDGDPAAVGEDLAERFRSRGHKVSIEIHGGRDAVAAIARICRARSCDAIVVGGGDGTVSAAAAAVAENGLVLGVLPLGTMNLFARSLGIPLDLAEAADALATADTVAVDIGSVNGVYFTHHVTLGLHPRMIRIRERLHYGSRIGKIWASAQACWVVVRQPPRLSVHVRTDDVEFDRKTAAILVSNNPLGKGHLPYADDLRQGMLGVYVATSRRWRDLLELAARIAFGEIAETPLLERRVARNVEISISRPLVNGSVDGEIVSLTPPLRIKLHHGGLRVLKPRAESGISADEPSMPVKMISRQRTELPSAARVRPSYGIQDEIA